MARLVGIVLMVLAVWVAAEVFTKGTHGAFGGALAFLGGEPPETEHRWAGERARESVGRAQRQHEDRVERLIGQ